MFRLGDLSQAILHVYAYGQMAWSHPNETSCYIFNKNVNLNYHIVCYENTECISLYTQPYIKSNLQIMSKLLIMT